VPPFLTPYGTFLVSSSTTFKKDYQDASLTTYQSDSCSIAGVNIWNSKLAGSNKTLTVYLP
jgi:hypothetical protein